MSGDWQNGAGTGDTFTETTRRSWFERVKGALAGLLVGLLLVPIACVMLFWNEGRAVQTARSLAEGAASVVSADAARVDPALEGRLVHVAGPLTVPRPPADREFGVQAPAGTTRLLRRVEMFQWREDSRSETRTSLGGAQETVTTYSYRQVWAPDRIDSGRFRTPDGHQNPQPRVTALSLTAPEAHLGARRLNEAQLRDLGEERPLDPAPTALPQAARLVGNQILLAADPDRPRIGDLRISFAHAAPQTASVVARQAGDGFASFRAPSGDQILMVVPSQVPASQMFAEAEAANRVLTWVLRAVGAVLMLVGFGLLMAPLGVLGSVIPFVGSLLSAGSWLVALLLTLVVSPVIVATAWLFYRPLVAVGVLAVGFGLAFGVGYLLRSRAKARPRIA
jgi:hypothetical protein